MDLPGVLEIEQASFSNPWSREAFLASLDRGDVAAYVYAPGRRVLAYLVMNFDGMEAHIMNLAVHPEYRRRGMAQECLRFAERIARRREVSRIALEVEESNLAAQLCYKKAGYRGVRVLRNFYAETDEDGYRMVRRLVNTARTAS